MTAELTMTNAAGLASVASLWLFVSARAFQKAQKWCVRLAVGSFLVTFVGISAVLTMRWLSAERFPIANLYESLLLFAWAVIAVFLGITYRYRHAYFGWVAALIVSAIFLFCSWLPASQRDISPLMPALVSYWRAIHVPPLMVSYALLLSGGTSAIGYLWSASRRKTAATLAVAAIISGISIALGLSRTLDLQYLQLLFWGGSAVTLFLSVSFLKQESACPVPDSKAVRLYDEISHRCITLAFPLLTFGIITGALWANHAWGTYWSWDPKESMSLVTWLSYAIYLHWRIRSACSHQAVSVSRDVASLLAVVGLLLTLLTYLGFNVLGFGGLHSYGKID